MIAPARGFTIGFAIPVLPSSKFPRIMNMDLGNVYRVKKPVVLPSVSKPRHVRHPGISQSYTVDAISGTHNPNSHLPRAAFKRAVEQVSEEASENLAWAVEELTDQHHHMNTGAGTKTTVFPTAD